MNINEIIERNYQATKSRGLISESTRIDDFIDKLKEEIEELTDSFIAAEFTHFDEEELADIALVCFVMAKHFEIDLIQEMWNKTIYNELRKD